MAPEQKSEMHRRGNLKRNYGLSHGDYTAMFKAQGGVCAICSLPSADGKNMHIDHDHDSGEVRSLLCSKCNTGLGLFDDDILKMKKAIEYIAFHSRKVRAA